MVAVALMVWFDRSSMGIWFKKDRGPNVVGPFGLLQTVADALKYILKEIIIPASAKQNNFYLSPN